MLSPLLTQREAASVLSISVRSLERMRVSGLGPRLVKVGVSVRYQPEALERWITAQSRASTSEQIGEARGYGGHIIEERGGRRYLLDPPYPPYPPYPPFYFFLYKEIKKEGWERAQRTGLGAFEAGKELEKSRREWKVWKDVRKH